MELPAFCDGSYQAQSILVDQERTINWYPEVSEVPGASTRVSLVPTPGLELFADLGAARGVGRALWSGNTTSDYAATNSGRVFGVVGGRLIEILIGGTWVDRGPLPDDGLPATISWSGPGGDELFITSGGNGYIFDLNTNTLTQVLTGEAHQGGFLHGYFLALNQTTGRLRLSNLYDGLTWDPTQFVERSAQADPWQAMHVTPTGFVVLIGTSTGEWWYDSGEGSFPFVLHPSSSFSAGIAAPFTLRQVGDAVVWLANSVDGGYYIASATGFAPERVSTYPLDHQMALLPRVSDAVADVHSFGGHIFYALSFPTAKRTFVYDARTRRWHERGTWMAENNQFDVWRPTWSAFAFGRVLLMDRWTGDIYALSLTTWTDVEGRPIRRVRRAPVIVDERRRFVHRAFELLVETGLHGQQGVEPVLLLRLSDDGGVTWGNEHQGSLGRIGEYHRRVVWRGLGLSRLRVYEVSSADAVPVRLAAAYVDLAPTVDQTEPRR